MSRYNKDAIGPCAASEKRRQRQFGEIMGIVANSVVIPEDYHAISNDQAFILAEGADHLFVPACVSETCDGYFTPMEITRAASQMAAREPVTMCNCRAHRFIQDVTTSRASREDMQIIIRAKEPLTDDGGKVFARAFIKLIMDFALIDGTLQPVSSGSEWAVSYSLIQGDSVTRYRGFIMRKDSGIGARFILTGVGESQSNLKDSELRKPESNNSKIACVAQQNCKHDGRRTSKRRQHPIFYPTPVGVRNLQICCRHLATEFKGS